MLALIAVWMSLVCLALAGVMLVYPPAFKQWSIILFLEVLAPAALCFAGLVLWSHRKVENPEPAIVAQRLQCKVAIGLTLVAVAAVYVIFLVLADKA